MQNTNKLWVEHGYGTRFQGFQNLMRFRIRDILFVSSLYDSYVFEEDGRLYELIRNEYLGLNLSHSPELTRVTNGHEAIEIAKEEDRFDLIITFRLMTLIEKGCLKFLSNSLYFFCP